MRIDIHAHFLPEETMRQLQRIDRRYAPRLEHGPAYDTMVVADVALPRFHRGGWDVATRLEEMEGAGVDAQAACQLSQTFFYWIEAKVALEFAQAQNEGLAALARAHPGRFYPLAAVPLQDPAAAARELERAVKQLGMYGVETGSNVAGKNFDDPSLEPFFAKLDELGCFWLIHPDRVAPKERLGKYQLMNLVGNPTDTTIAIASLVFGGIFERYPNVRVVTCHAGGFYPYQYGRLERGYRVLDEPKAAIAREPSSYADRVYFDIITHSKPALEYLVQTFGADHVLLGTDSPFIYSMGLSDPVGVIESLESVDADGKALIAGGNAARLLGIDRPTAW
ncbi:MAG: amidohydrolase [Chloroflexi bacterium]|nr:amidohydrolase [Chloroflexota bacterium]